MLKNEGKKTAKNIKFRIENTLENKVPPRIDYRFSSSIPVSHIREGQNVQTFFAPQWYLGGGDEYIITASFELSGGTPIPEGKHILACKFWADSLDVPVEKQLTIVIKKP